MNSISVFFLASALIMTSSVCAAAAVDYGLVSTLKVPPGFKISLWAKVPGARSLTKAPDGTVFVGSGGLTGRVNVVYRIKDWNKNGKIDGDEVETLIDGLNNPNGVAFRKDSLYVGEIDRVLVFKGVLNVPKGQPIKYSEGKALPQKFPDKHHHGWKFIRFAPPPNDHWLYVPVGAPCNVCTAPTPMFNAIHRIDVNSDKLETVAVGVRNTVGFDFHPTSGNLWFTDNGRDMLGDDIPPDELNELSVKGENFGFPFVHGRGIADPEFKAPVGFKSSPPRVEFGAHVASLGMRFYRGTKFPGYKGKIFVAHHGSWNRSKRSGYRVVVVSGAKDKWTSEDFITGWLDEKTEKVWGRPVDVEELSDGSLLISDDGVRVDPQSGAIYKLEYTTRGS